MPGQEGVRLEEAARSWFASHLSGPVAVDTLGLFVEPSPGAAFGVLETVTLARAGVEKP